MGNNTSNQQHNSSEKRGKIAKVVVVRDLCIGAASCIAVAPDVYDLDEENIAVVKKQFAADDETLLESARVCPTQAIYLYDEEGNQVFPEETPASSS